MGSPPTFFKFFFFITGLQRYRTILRYWLGSVARFYRVSWSANGNPLHVLTSVLAADQTSCALRTPPLTQRLADFRLGLLSAICQPSSTCMTPQAPTERVWCEHEPLPGQFSAWETQPRRVVASTIYILYALLRLATTELEAPVTSFVDDGRATRQQAKFN